MMTSQRAQTSCKTWFYLTQLILRKEENMMEVGLLLWEYSSGLSTDLSASGLLENKKVAPFFILHEKDINLISFSHTLWDINHYSRAWWTACMDTKLRVPELYLLCKRMIGLISFFHPHPQHRSQSKHILWNPCKVQSNGWCHERRSIIFLCTYKYDSNSITY